MRAVAVQQVLYEPWIVPAHILLPNVKRRNTVVLQMNGTVQIAGLGAILLPVGRKAVTVDDAAVVAEWQALSH